MKVSEIMTTSVCTITSDKSVSHAAEKMNECNTNYLVVVDHGELLGMITSRNVGSAHPNRIVADAMDMPPRCISPEYSVWEAQDILRGSADHVFLVMDQEQVVGVVTREAVQVKLAQNLDPLTGLYRAPYIQHVGEKWLVEHKPFHLLFIDVNDFGEINKLYGHPIGDDVIRTFSSALSAMVVEQEDHLCRYAGDEFIVLSTSSNERVLQFIENIVKPTVICDVRISAAVGHIDGYQEPNFFRWPLRDLISKASLLSTAAKKNKAIPGIPS